MGRWLSPAVITALAIASQVHVSDAADSSQLKPCPVRCQDAADPSRWTLYNSVERLTVCKEPTIFEVSLSAPLRTISEIVAVRACTAGEGQGAFRAAALDSGEQPDLGRIAKRDGDERECTAPSKKSSHLQFARWGSRDVSQDVLSAALDLLREVQTWSSKAGGCQSTILLGHLNGTFAGYVGNWRIEDQGALETLGAVMSSDFQADGVSGRTILQHCGVSQGTNSSTSAQKDGGGVAAGLVVSRDGDLEFVHKSMRLWSDAKCVQGAGGSYEDLSGSMLPVYPFPEVADGGLQGRQSSSTCRTIQVQAGDSCTALAQRCKISGADYTKFNSASGHCANLKEGQHVCCSSGKLPDVRPKPEADGSCRAYTTQSGDYCSKIAISNGLTVDELSGLNKETWGWSGCEPLGLRVTLCLSEGTPPMPASVDNAECGPTKLGSRPPRGDQTMADLNPCPLNVCCNIWGQCGLTSDFCTVEKSKTGAPGTSGHRNGCVQNCDTQIVNNNVKPQIFRKLGYFEAWNFNRKCLRMDVEKTMRHKQQYTDIHFAFGEISESLDPYIPDNQKAQWNRFVKMQNPPDSVPVRKVLAFGGWTFSTHLSTYRRFPNAVKPGNRAAFARKVVDFAKAHNLDGIDFDWEYPGAPDLPGLPPGGADEGPNYLAFLQEVRNIMPKEMTLSIAAPASYWYLKAFPIARMAPLLDYIVFMTYDLHGNWLTNCAGQWDWDNPWSSPGCPAGNCLRSHVNDTETEDALVMITKAGVPAHKVLVGVATYGRSFKMTTPGCTGPDCTFVGDKDSPAAKGECTDTGGYLALAEINKILKENPSARYWIDTESGSGSNVMVYNRTEWVAYMDDNVRRGREVRAFRRNFGGTIEWAVDLQEELHTSHGPEGPPSGGGLDPGVAGAWLDVTCEHPDLDDASDDRSIRWTAARADSAWSDVLAAWKRERSLPQGHKDKKNLPFTQFVSNFFNGPDEMRCHDLIDTNNCHGVSILCDETKGNFRPASWLILLSFRNLNGMFWNLFQSIGRVEGRAADMMKEFTKTFLDEEKKSLTLAIIIDILTMGYAAAMAPLWNKAFSKGIWAKHPDGYNTIKDATNDLTYSGMSLVKDVIARDETDLDEEAELVKYLLKMTKVWQRSIIEFNEYLFDGTDEDGLKLLSKMMARGNLLNMPGMSAQEIDDSTYRGIYSTLIPYAWRMSDKDYNPFIVDSGLSCDDASNDDTIKRRLKKEVLETEKVCDGTTGRGYFLASVRKPSSNCRDVISGPAQGASCEPFPKLGGTETLSDDNFAWGVISKEDMVLGSIATFKANGHKNRVYRPDNYNKKEEDWKGPLASMQDNALRTAGVFDIPVCHINTALTNALDKRRKDKEGRGYYFPCDEVDSRISY